MKIRSILAVAVISTALLSIVSCTKSNKTIIRMQHIEEGVANPNTVEEYKEAISKYEERVADIQLAQSQIGIWHKIVGTRYLDKKLYGEALKSFQKALEYYPDNQNLYYYVGLCASYMSHQALDYEATGDFTKRNNYLKLAEEAYNRAISIDPRYARALYAVSVLYDFEFMEPEKAIPNLETLLTIEKKHLDGMILLARCYYETYQFDKAIEIYDRYIESTNMAERKQLAQNLKEQVMNAKEGLSE